MWRSIVHKVVRVRADCPRSVVRPRQEACLGKIFDDSDLVTRLLLHLGICHATLAP
jgi:hypothetical protein